MFLRAVNEPLEVVRLEALFGKRDIERTNKGSARRGILSIDGRLKRPARLVNVRIFLYLGGHCFLLYYLLNKFRDIIVDVVENAHRRTP